MKYLNCYPADALVAGTVYRVTFTQTTAQRIGSFLDPFVGFGSELQAIYQRAGDSNKSPYAFVVSEPPTIGTDAVVLDVKVRSQEFHAGTVADLVRSLDGLSPFVDVSQIEYPSRKDLGTSGRASALERARQQGEQQAADTGFFAGLSRTLGDLKTVVLVVAVGAAVVAAAYVVGKFKAPASTS